MKSDHGHVQGEQHHPDNVKKTHVEGPKHANVHHVPTQTTPNANDGAAPGITPPPYVGG